MKLIIAGSRNLTVDQHLIHWLIYTCFKLDPKMIIAGESGNVDICAKFYAQSMKNTGMQYKGYAAKWGKLGRKAGPIRNGQMAQDGDALLLIWDGKSRGSANMKSQMIKLKKPVYECILRS